MKIKAKKTNSASENAIRSSYFVIELRKLIHLLRSTEVIEATDSCTLVSYFGLKCKWVESLCLRMLWLVQGRIGHHG